MNSARGAPVRGLDNPILIPKKVPVLTQAGALATAALPPRSSSSSTPQQINRSIFNFKQVELKNEIKSDPALERAILAAKAHLDRAGGSVDLQVGGAPRVVGPGGHGGPSLDYSHHSRPSLHDRSLSNLLINPEHLISLTDAEATRTQHVLQQQQQMLQHQLQQIQSQQALIQDRLSTSNLYSVPLSNETAASIDNVGSNNFYSSIHTTHETGSSTARTAAPLLPPPHTPHASQLPIHASTQAQIQLPPQVQVQVQAEAQPEPFAVATGVSSSPPVSVVLRSSASRELMSLGGSTRKATAEHSVLNVATKGAMECATPRVFTSATASLFDLGLRMRQASMRNLQPSSSAFSSSSQSGQEVAGVQGNLVANAITVAASLPSLSPPLPPVVGDVHLESSAGRKDPKEHYQSYLSRVDAARQARVRQQDRDLTRTLGQYAGVGPSKSLATARPSTGHLHPQSAHAQLIQSFSELKQENATFRAGAQALSELRFADPEHESSVVPAVGRQLEQRPMVEIPKFDYQRKQDGIKKLSGPLSSTAGAENTRTQGVKYIEFVPLSRLAPPKPRGCRIIKAPGNYPEKPSGKYCPPPPQDPEPKPRGKRCNIQIKSVEKNPSKEGKKCDFSHPGAEDNSETEFTHQHKRMINWVPSEPPLLSRKKYLVPPRTAHAVVGTGGARVIWNVGNIHRKSYIMKDEEGLPMLAGNGESGGGGGRLGHYGLGYYTNSEGRPDTANFPLAEGPKQMPLAVANARVYFDPSTEKPQFSNWNSNGYYAVNANAKFIVVGDALDKSKNAGANRAAVSGPTRPTTTATSTRPTTTATGTRTRPTTTMTLGATGQDNLAENGAEAGGGPPLRARMSTQPPIHSHLLELPPSANADSMFWRDAEGRASGAHTSARLGPSWAGLGGWAKGDDKTHTKFWGSIKGVSYDNHIEGVLGFSPPTTTHRGGSGGNEGGETYRGGETTQRGRGNGDDNSTHRGDETYRSQLSTYRHETSNESNGNNKENQAPVSSISSHSSSLSSSSLSSSSSSSSSSTSSHGSAPFQSATKAGPLQQNDKARIVWVSHPMTGKFSGFTVPPGQFGEIVGRPAIPGPAAVGLRPGLGLLQDMERANKLNELPHWSSMPKYVAPPRQ